MKSLLFTVLSLMLVGSTRADALGDAVEVTPPADWMLTSPGQPSPFPTLRYVPRDGRNATVLLTLIPGDLAKVADSASLKKFHRILQQPYLVTPNDTVPLTEFKLPQGFGVYAVFEDPDLVGKPVRKGSYKIAAPVAIFLTGGHVIQATVLTDVRENAMDFQQAIKLAQSVAPRSPASEKTVSAVSKKMNGRQTIAVPPLGAVLLLPARFQPTPKMNSDPGYFSFADDQHVIQSGWLSRAAGFRGMREFWAKEKAALVANLGEGVADESFKIINGWNVVLYTLALPGVPEKQKNIRACRVVGDTWADVHLSVMEPDSTWKSLEVVLSTLSLVPK